MYLFRTEMIRLHGKRAAGRSRKKAVCGCRGSVQSRRDAAGFQRAIRCTVFIECLIFFFRIIIFQNMSIHMERGKCRKRKLRNAEASKVLRQSRWFINNFTSVIGIEIISTSCQKADIYRILVICPCIFQYSGKPKRKEKALQICDMCYSRM